MWIGILILGAGLLLFRKPKARRRSRRNPSTSHDEKAYKGVTGVYQGFHGVSPKGVRTVSYQPPDKNVPLVKIGDVSQINYIPSLPSKRAGVEYTHRSGDTGSKMLKTNLILATDKKGKNLYLLKKTGSKYPIFTSRGVIG